MVMANEIMASVDTSTAVVTRLSARLERTRLRLRSSCGGESKDMSPIDEAS